MFQNIVFLGLLPLFQVSCFPGLPLQKRGAAPFDPQFPYTHAREDGLPGL